MMPSPARRGLRVLGTLSAATFALALGACASDDASTTPDPSTSSATSSVDDASTPSSTDEETESSSQDHTQNASASASLPEDVDAVFEVFGDLAPEELFAKFEACSPTDINDGYSCSGRGIGQFNFYESEEKAAQVLGLLHGLESSEIVDDSEDRVVGWRTLGASVVLNIVDVEKGLVAEHLVAGDPAEVAAMLGFVEPSEEAEDSEDAESSPSSTPTSSSAEAA